MRTEREKSLHGEGRREERESNDFRLNSLGEERRREREKKKEKISGKGWSYVRSDNEARKIQKWDITVWRQP